MPVIEKYTDYGIWLSLHDYYSSSANHEIHMFVPLNEMTSKNTGEVIEIPLQNFRNGYILDGIKITRKTKKYVLGYIYQVEIRNDEVIKHIMKKFKIDMKKNSITYEDCENADDYSECD